MSHKRPLSSVTSLSQTTMTLTVTTSILPTQPDYGITRHPSDDLMRPHIIEALQDIYDMDNTSELTRLLSEADGLSLSEVRSHLYIITFAIKHGDLPLAKQIIELFDYDIHDVLSRQCDLLWTIIKHNRLDALAYIIWYFNITNIDTLIDHDRPFLVAIQFHRIDILRFLIDTFKPPLYVVSDHNHRPLMLAAEYGHTAVIKYLVSAFPSIKSDILSVPGIRTSIKSIAIDNNHPQTAAYIDAL